MKIILVFLFLSLCIGLPNWAQVPHLINYQGRLTSEGINFDGEGQFKFALVDGTGSTTFWSHDGTSLDGSEPVSSISLGVQNGLYAVALGDAPMDPIPSIVFENSDVNLRVWFSDGVNGFQSLGPDQRISAVGYALVADRLHPLVDVNARRLNIGADHTGLGDLATIAGGSDNEASAAFASVGGGENNRVGASHGTIGGGKSNFIPTSFATIAGGENNVANFPHATVGGGFQNSATGNAATVPGGANNIAFADYAFAAGRQARANHEGTFVWADSTDAQFVSSGPNQFIIRAAGGVGINTASPEKALHVAGDIRLDAGGDISFGNDNTRILKVFNDLLLTSDDIVLEAVDDILIDPNDVLRVGGSAFVVDTTSGNVGIGTIFPGARLHVIGPRIRLATTGNSTRTIELRTDGGALDLTANDANLFVKSNTGNTIIQDHGGSVGIRTTNPGFTLHVNGTAGKPGGGEWSVASDARLKKKIQNLDGALEQLLKLRGVTFEYINPEQINELPGERMGMIAQEVEKVFPDWIEISEDGYRRQTTRGFSALTVEALRDLRAEKDVQIANLQSEVVRQQGQIEELINRLDSLVSMLDGKSQD